MAHLQGSGSPITQVSQTPVGPMHLQPQLLTRLQLDLRGKRFTVDRETIMNLPESILLCLFPNDLVLSRQSAMLSDGGDNDEFEELYGVDVRCPRLSHSLRSPLPSQFDPDCFSFVLAFFKQSADVFYGTPNSPGLYAAQQLLPQTSIPLRCRTPSCPYYVKSWSTSLYHPRLPIPAPFQVFINQCFDICGLTFPVPLMPYFRADAVW